MIDTFQRYLYVYNYIKRNAHNKKIYKVLDVGPNGPGLARYVSEFKNLELTLLETKEFLKEDIKAFPNVKFITYDGKRSTFSDKSFDLVTCIDTFEHIPHKNREGFIKELSRVAKNDIIMSFPLDHSEPFEKVLRLIFLNKIKFLDEHKQFGLPNEELFRKFIKKARLAVTETDNNINLYLWIPVKLFSSLMNKFLTNKENLIYKFFKIYSRGMNKIITIGKPYSKTFLLRK